MLHKRRQNAYFIIFSESDKTLFIKCVIRHIVYILRYPPLASDSNVPTRPVNYLGIDMTLLENILSYGVRTILYDGQRGIRMNYPGTSTILREKVLSAITVTDVLVFKLLCTIVSFLF